MRILFTVVAALCVTDYVGAGEHNPDQATFGVFFNGRPTGSATCVYSEGGQSVLVTNHHVCAVGGGGGPQSPARFPISGTIKSRDGKTHPFTAHAGSYSTDVAFLIAEADLPFAPLAPTDAPTGTCVWHRGWGSGGFGGGSANGFGRRLARSGSGSGSFASTVRSVPGDSGAGIMDPCGRLVGVNCGLFTASGPQRGATVSEVRAAFKQTLSKLYARVDDKGHRVEVTGGVAEQRVSDGKGGHYVRYVTK